MKTDTSQGMLSVAQFYKNQRRTRAGINQAILDAFSVDAQINENIRIISRLPIFTYWTTNYDELLEKGIREANRNPDVKSESDQLSNMKRDRDAIVYKMHGDVNHPAKAVLTKEDYLFLYQHLIQYQKPTGEASLSNLQSQKVVIVQRHQKWQHYLRV